LLFNKINKSKKNISGRTKSGTVGIENANELRIPKRKGTSKRTKGN
jgi:hypothetical protein